MRELAMTDVEMAEVLNLFFTSVLTGSQDYFTSHIPEACILEPLGGK